MVRWGGVLLYEGDGSQYQIEIGRSAADFRRLGIGVRNTSSYTPVDAYVETPDPDGRSFGICVGSNQWQSVGIAAVSVSGTALTVSGEGVSCGFTLVVGFK